MPLVTQLREGSHPLILPRDLCVSPMDQHQRLVKARSISPTNGAPGSNNGGDGFACSDCGRIYKLKSSLRNHQKWECGKEPQFKCPYCVYRAKQKMHIGRHLERMHKERFFKIESDKVIAYDDEHAKLMIKSEEKAITFDPYIKTDQS